jgi:hypothetical protein
MSYTNPVLPIDCVSDRAVGLLYDVKSGSSKKIYTGVYKYIQLYSIVSVTFNIGSNSISVTNYISIGALNSVNILLAYVSSCAGSGP